MKMLLYEIIGKVAGAQITQHGPSCMCILFGIYLSNSLMQLLFFFLPFCTIHQINRANHIANRTYFLLWRVCDFPLFFARRVSKYVI